MQGAIFDVDGTILDSMSVWYDVTEQFFKQNHIRLTDETGIAFQEMTLHESTTLMHEQLKFPQRPEEIEQILKEMVAHEYFHNIKLKPYAKEYITSLYRAGVRLGIATSGYKELCMGAFMRHGIWDMFDAIALSGEVGVNKTNPDVYLLAAQRMQVQPAACTVYEDIVSGIIGAKKANMRTVGVYDSANPDTQQLKEHADLYIVSFQELL